MTADDHLSELWRKVDAFFARVAERYPAELACAAGCSDCCMRELTVTPIEADRIAALVRGLDAEARAALADRARVQTGACAALRADGTCSIYDARPLVCRSHGVPVRYVEPGESAKRSLPVLDVCPKNFRGHDLERVDAACVLDQQTLSVLLGTIDSLRARERGEPQGARLALRDVLLSAAS